MTRQEQHQRAAQHAASLIRQFDDEEILVMLEGVALFLYHVYCASLEPQGLTFEDFCHDVGASLGAMHEHRMMAQQRVINARMNH